MDLTISEIKNLAEFAGLQVNVDGMDDEMDSVLCVVPCPKGELLVDDVKPVKYEGNIAYFGEYPDEGCVPLGDVIEGERMINIIPAMSDSLGQHWNQPDRKLIEVDETHALMDMNAFSLLSDYSWGFPSGVYEGKMWKSMDSSGKWWLRWYGPSEDPECCSNNRRAILVVSDN